VLFDAVLAWQGDAGSSYCMVWARHATKALPCLPEEQWVQRITPSTQGTTSPLLLLLLLSTPTVTGDFTTATS
jgi:hypothetical protein